MVAIIRQDEIRTPPHSVEAEQAVLGGLMLDGNAWDAVADIVTAGDFYRRDHRLIFESIAEVAENRGSCDAVTVSEHLERKGRLDEVGGLAYLGTIARDTPSAANVRAYAEIIRERSILRQLVAAGGEIAASATDSRGRSAGELVDEAERRVFEIAERGSRGRTGFIAIRDVLPQTIDRLDLLHQNPGEVRGVPTGFTQLDRKTTGLQPGDLVVIAGRPSMGKTTLAVNIAENAAIAKGVPSAIFSMEMSAEQLTLRLISSLGRVNQTHLRTGHFSEEDWSRIQGAMSQLSNAPLYVDESPALTPTEVRARTPAQARARARADRGGLPAADAGAGHQGEPRDRDLRDLAQPQGARQGTAGARGRAVAAEPRGRTAHRQAARDVGPPRVGRDRAGQRPDPPDLPRGGLRRDHDAPRRRRHHHRETAQRPRRRSPADLPRRVHALREPGRRVLRRGRILTARLRAVIDTPALAKNLARVRELAPGCRVMAVIKANAYGHGLVPVARALARADAFAVARIEEALELREAGIGARIVLLEGVQDAAGLATARRNGFELVVHQDGQVALLERCASGAAQEVWLKADTGMGRLGFRPGAFAEAHARLTACAAVRGPVRLMTHLAESEAGAAGRTAEQLARFAALTASLPGERSIANSAGLIAWPEARADWVRPGIMLYGVSPFPDRTGDSLGLEPAMRLESTVLAVRELAPGERVGYGGTWTAAGPSRVAIVGAGYGDGYPRSAASGAPILIGGRMARLAGRVSMDMLAADVSELPGVAVGDPVLLWGPGLPVETVAAAAGTIGYELTCRVSRRVPFEYIAA